MSISATAKPFELILLRDVSWVDPWGYSHRAQQIVDETIVSLSGTRPKNNGYEDYDAAVAVDDQGRTFWQQRTIDYHGQPEWIEDDSEPTRWWKRRLPYGRILDRNGDPIPREV